MPLVCSDELMTMSVVERFVAVATRNPAHPAVQHGGRVVSYWELYCLVLAMASRFADAGPCPKVLIVLPAVPEAYAAMLGALYAGGVYCCLNTASPRHKKQRIVDIFEPQVIVTSRGDHGWMAMPARCQTLFIDQIDNSSSFMQPLIPNIAYVMFTSGSFGDPKGVMIPYSALNHYVEWALEAFRPTQRDRWSQHPSIAFDLSVLDIYGTLCSGATLVPVVSKGHRLLCSLAIRDLELTIWNSVPSVIDLMVKSRKLRGDDIRSLRIASFCGEPLLPHHLAALFDARPDLTVFNTYGPTEATVSCTLRTLTRRNFHGYCKSSVSIGTPIRGMKIYLIGGDADQGEMAIAGPQVALGYMNARDEARSAFVELELEGGIQRMYMTGDWAVRENGELYFVGRKDNQIKIKGHRLELDEIDQAIRECGFSETRTICHDGELHAFLAAAKPFDETALKSALSARLDPHAVPTTFHALESLPRNENDKIDSAALRHLIAETDLGGRPKKS